MSRQLVAQKLAPVFGKDGDFTVVVEDTCTFDVNWIVIPSVCTCFFSFRMYIFSQIVFVGFHWNIREVCRDFDLADQEVA